MSDNYWKNLYIREVEGLNNEGDPIGGDPPDGFRHRVARLIEENTKLRDELDNTNAKLARLQHELKVR